jgi:oligopeptide/dipeptide ABC transporter ATP-binding protein
MNWPLLKVEHLRVTFPRRGGTRSAAVDDLSFNVAQGEALVIVGESGSGKTLTALSILGLTPRTARIAGTIAFEGTDLSTVSERHMRRIRGRDISMIYQDPMSALDPVWSVGNQIVETILQHEKVSRSVAHARAVALLERVGLPEPKRIARAFPHELSGGMRQRALIAMALACSPKLLIGDEPTTALDVTIQAQILELLKELQRDLGLTIILITHNMGVAANLADRVLVMYAGRAVEVGTSTRIFKAPFHPYTQALLRSAEIREFAPKTPLAAIPGAPPPIDARPAGCPFHLRCPRAQPDCSAARPDLRGTDDELAACYHPVNELPESALRMEVAGA